jgi:hypothetical protein
MYWFRLLIPICPGLCIEYWKLKKAFNAAIVPTPGRIIPYRLIWTISDSYKLSKTKEYDDIATKNLLFVIIPLVIGYSIYSLVYRSVFVQIVNALFFKISSNMSAQIVLLMGSK